MQERAKRAAIIRIAAASEHELRAWQNSSLKVGVSLTSMVENDTNGDGPIGAGDLTNSGLAAAGVCAQYVEAQSGPAPARALKSPWRNVALWLTTAPGQGQISCVQTGSTGIITVTAYDNGTPALSIYTKNISSD